MNLETNPRGITTTKKITPTQKFWQLINGEWTDITKMPEPKVLKLSDNDPHLAADRILLTETFRKEKWSDYTVRKEVLQRAAIKRLYKNDWLKQGLPLPDFHIKFSNNRDRYVANYLLTKKVNWDTGITNHGGSI